MGEEDELDVEEEDEEVVCGVEVEVPFESELMRRRLVRRGLVAADALLSRPPQAVCMRAAESGERPCEAMEPRDLDVDTRTRSRRPLTRKTAPRRRKSGQVNTATMPPQTTRLPALTPSSITASLIAKAETPIMVKTREKRRVTRHSSS